MKNIGQTIQQMLPQQKQQWQVSEKNSQDLEEVQNNLVKFCENFNPSTQQKYCIDIVDCINGNYPTLAELNKQFRDKLASEIWLTAQLQNLATFTGCKEKLLKEQYDELSSIIANEYYYLKVTELMLFFYQFKCGYYGNFYGSVDPIVVMTNLRNFIKFRNNEIAKYEQEERKRAREEHDKKFPPITYEEYKKKLKKKENEH